MALIPTYGGTMTLNFQGGGAVEAEVKNVRVEHLRGSSRCGLLSSHKVRKRPGRVERMFAFDLWARDGSTDNALRTHMWPDTAAANAIASVVMSWTDAAGIAYTATGFLTAAILVYEGEDWLVFACSMEESL